MLGFAPRAAGTVVSLAAVVVAVVAVVAACDGGQPQEVPKVTSPESITVTSSAFTQGQPIPAEFTCDGPGTVPPLAWEGVPTNAAALALVVDDPDAPSGTFTHWVVLDLPSATKGLTGGSLPAGAVQATNSGGRVGWYPPCPPSGTHHYRFVVHALSKATGLANGAPLKDALRAIDAATMAQGRLVGTYTR
jgi:Raf kinase inhibitor-like YbhB/YbcL family protein